MVAFKSAIAAAMVSAVVISSAAQADAISDYFCANPTSTSASEFDCTYFSSERHDRHWSKWQERHRLTKTLKSLIRDASDGDRHAFYLPESWDYRSIPQDPSNRLTYWKVRLGKFLFHDTAFALAGKNVEREGTWSCASCHHAAAGFKAGIRQGIGEGGDGFGRDGSARRMSPEFSAGGAWEGQADVQPVASPTILNSAYQDVMLWNGQFGNARNSINANLPHEILATPGTPKAENDRRLSGIETQAVAGTGVHRLDFESNISALKQNRRYRRFYRNAFPQAEEGDDVLQNTSLAIAAYERTVLANRSPFQKFLRGRDRALDMQELRGGIVFFEKGKCVDCHRGPALSSKVGASEDEMFFAIGFDDFDPADPEISGPVTDNDKRGRGGFTRKPEDAYKFKIPQLYNLADSDVFGHGASFTSVREVVEYKNRGQAQVLHGDGKYLDHRFKPLGLTDAEVDDLVMFLENALYDPRLRRYVPGQVPSGQCFPVADAVALQQLDCH